MSGNNVQVLSNIQLHYCEICSRTFSSAKHLKRHTKNFHERDYYFKCAYCNKGINHKDNLKRHLKNQHEITELIEGIQFQKEKLFTISELETSNPNQNQPISVQEQSKPVYEIVVVVEAKASSSKAGSSHNDVVPSKSEHVKSQLSAGPVVVLTELIDGIHFTKEKLFTIPELETLNPNQNQPISVPEQPKPVYQMVVVEEAKASSSKALSHNDVVPSKSEHVKSQLSTGPVVVPTKSKDIVAPIVQERVVLKAVRPSAKQAQPSASARLRPSSRLEDDLPASLIELLKNITIEDVINSPLCREREVLETKPVCPFGQGGLKKMLNDFFVMKKYIDHQFETKFPQLDKSSSLTDKINHLQSSSEK